MSERVYIAGPMRGHKFWNWPAFDAMAERLRALGMEPVNPADLDRDCGLEAPEDGAPPREIEFNNAMARDLEAIEHCSSIVLLEGWEDSEGANVERSKAAQLGLKIYRESDIELMEEAQRRGYNVDAADAFMGVFGFKRVAEGDQDRRRTATGAERDARGNKGRYDLLPPEAVLAWAKRLEGGAEHYGDRNWENGMNLSWFLDSGIRHAFQCLAGDTSEDHAAAVLFNFGAYIAGRERIARGEWPTELDDLPKKDATTPD